ncbi:CoA-binding protein [Jeongeupia chitinilytica]|uniref:CoA-binding protein n=1 Tax=Jeongeupia chitinilytica TaxID=1041641 RepID=A0ABQ3H4G8_9NEIS|nr:CoA-binding protein [Jeongeupia chitinilytica]GHD66873.1 CoA-binding protein [Jeongeupia chitinilytica]
MFHNPTDAELRDFLSGVRRIAVVGLSPKRDRPSFRVAWYLQAEGFSIVPVRPGVDDVLGETAYPTLEDVPGDVDLVDVFRRAEEVGAVVEAAISKGARGIWIQSGIINEAAAERARDAGLFVVMDRCLMVEHARLMA